MCVNVREGKYSAILDDVSCHVRKAGLAYEPNQRSRTAGGPCPNERTAKDPTNERSYERSAGWLRPHGFGFAFHLRAYRHATAWRKGGRGGGMKHAWAAGLDTLSFFAPVEDLNRSAATALGANAAPSRARAKCTTSILCRCTAALVLLCFVLFYLGADP